MIHITADISDLNPLNTDAHQSSSPKTQAGKRSEGEAAGLADA